MIQHHACLEIFKMGHMQKSRHTLLPKSPFTRGTSSADQRFECRIKLGLILEC